MKKQSSRRAVSAGMVPSWGKTCLSAEPPRPFDFRAQVRSFTNYAIFSAFLPTRGGEPALPANPWDGYLPAARDSASPLARATGCPWPNIGGHRLYAPDRGEPRPARTY